jgi:hypothetical protein
MIDRESYLRLRDRFRATGEIDIELYELLRRLARAVVYTGHLAPAYSPTGTWNEESIMEATHSWIERRLLQTNALLAAFDIAADPRPFLNSLERNFRHHLENAKERGELGNLISRTGALLREDPAFTDWVPRQRASDTWWGLSAWESPEAYQGSDDDLIAHAWALGEFPIFRYSQSVERASPVLSTETLREFLLVLFERLERLLTISHFAVVYSRRFNLGPPVEVQITAEIGDGVPEPVEPSDEQVRAATAALVSELSPRQVEAISRRARDETLEEIAAALGVSRGTADNALRSAAPLIDKHCVDGVTRELVLEKLLDALS